MPSCVSVSLLLESIGHLLLLKRGEKGLGTSAILRVRPPFPAAFAPHHPVASPLKGPGDYGLHGGVRPNENRPIPWLSPSSGR